LIHGADVNEKDEKSGFTPLLQAIDLAFIPDYPELGMVDFLISRGARQGIFALLWQGDFDGVKALLEEEPDSVNAVGPGGGTPLCYAGTAKTAQLLLDHGADLYARLDAPWGSTTPMRWVANQARLFGNFDLFRFLLDQASVGIDIFLACVLNDVEQVTTALESDPALVHATTGNDHVLEPGLTPLHLAAQFGRAEIATILLEHGADVNAMSRVSNDMTSLHLAIRFGGKELSSQPLAEIVQEYGVYHLCPELPRLLLEHGADVNVKDSERNLTPLGWAEADLEDETDRSEVAALLREFGAQE
jgi:ankyrin repeat protein